MKDFTQEINPLILEEDKRIGEIRKNKIDERNREHILRVFAELDANQKEKEKFFFLYPDWQEKEGESREDVVKRLLAEMPKI